MTKYDWDKWENLSRYHLIKSQGKHAVFRLILDEPSNVEHSDLPQWLHDKHGENLGTVYNNSYGKGFAPDYSYTPFYEDYLVFISKLIEKYKDDPFISFIQLGVIGHWGEIHVNFGEGVKKLPLYDDLKRWFEPWKDVFPHAKIMMRRPFITARDNNWGIYNDMMGDTKSTNEWLSWIQNGANYDQTGEDGVVVPYVDGWTKSAIGGEFTSSTTMDKMLIDDYEITMNDFIKSHTTFIGQKIPDKKTHESQYNDINNLIGYKLFIPHVNIIKNKDNHTLNITWMNKGIAPFYFDWKVKLFVIDYHGNIKNEKEIDVDLTKLLPSQKIQSVTELTDYTYGKDRLSIGIVDPMDNLTKVKFNILTQEKNTKINLF